MKIKLSCAAFGLCSLLLSGCYTVIQGPRTAADLDDRELGITQGQAEKSTAERFDDYEEEWDEYYRYPGVPGSYGGGYGYGGYPQYGYGYSSDYGYYGYGYSPYYGYYGHGPSYYGYDPYYRDSRGYYIPAGYELVSSGNLNALASELSASRQALAELEDPSIAAAEEQRRLEQQRREEEAWLRRVEPRVRETPTPTPRSSSSSTSSYSAPSTTAKSKRATPPSQTCQASRYCSADHETCSWSTR